MILYSMKNILLLMKERNMIKFILFQRVIEWHGGGWVIIKIERIYSVCIFQSNMDFYFVLDCILYLTISAWGDTSYLLKTNVNQLHWLQGMFILSQNRTNICFHYTHYTSLWCRHLCPTHYDMLDIVGT